MFGVGNQDCLGRTSLGNFENQEVLAEFALQVKIMRLFEKIKEARAAPSNKEKFIVYIPPGVQYKLWDLKTGKEIELLKK